MTAGSPQGSKGRKTHLLEGRPGYASMRIAPAGACRVRSGSGKPAVNGSNRTTDCGRENAILVFEFGGYSADSLNHFRVQSKQA